MTTYREAIYMCLDLIKGTSDDFSYTEEHVAYLLDKFRALLLKQRYGNTRKREIPYSNYQTVEMNMQLSAFEANSYYVCTPNIPYTLQIGIPKISVATDHYGDVNLEYVSRERLPFVGNNRYLQNFWYCAIDERNRLCLKTSSVRLFEDYEAVSENTLIPTLTFRITALFENPRNLQDISDTADDYLDKILPIEEGLVTTLVELVVKELLGASYRPADIDNNNVDDNANMANFIARNMKSNFAKQLE